MALQTPDFYQSIRPQRRFADLARSDAYVSVPGDWLVGCADIEGSTAAVQAGLYKTVNMVGAAVISAQINAHGGAAFPYIFGGDGAGFAVPPDWAGRTAASLAAVQFWGAAGIRHRSADRPCPIV